MITLHNSGRPLRELKSAANLCVVQTFKVCTCVVQPKSSIYSMYCTFCTYLAGTNPRIGMEQAQSGQYLLRALIGTLANSGDGSLRLAILAEIGTLSSLL